MTVFISEPKGDELGKAPAWCLALPKGSADVSHLLPIVLVCKVRALLKEN